MKSVGVVLAACALALPMARADEEAPAAEPAVDEGCSRCTVSLETWFYATQTRLSGASLLNPGNRVAAIPETQSLLDVRLNLQGEVGPVQLVAAPRLVAQRDDAGSDTAQDARERITHTGSGVQWNQGYARVKLDTDTLVLGREVLTWGPATFRSPSNPWYFDSGRTQPLAVTRGIDLLRYTRGMGSWRVTAAYVHSTDPTNPTIDIDHAGLLKIDQQGSDYLVSLNIAKQSNAAGFVGGFGQFTPDDAWLVYGEFGMSSQPAPTGRTALAGASYTLESGQVITGEWLHNDSGFTRGQAVQYFQQASAANTLAQVNPAAGYGLLGEALAQSPRMMGRDYVWASMQSNPQDSKQYWRAELTRNVTDSSGQVTLYGEKNFVPLVSGFVVMTRNLGSEQTDYGSLVRTRLTLGGKLFLY